MKQFTFPSVVESHNSELRNVAPDLQHGIKIFDNGTGYIVGDLALSEGIAPHKAINCSPNDLDYQLLLQSALLVSASMSEAPMTVTLGFPFSTFQINRDAVKDYLGEGIEVTFDTSPYGGRERQTRRVQIEKVDVIPEVVGCIIGARRGERRQRGAFFMVSLGFGTCEAALSTEAGIVQRTMVSVPGIRYAVDLAIRELQETHYLGLRTEHQIDRAFLHGSIVINRQRIDLTDIRRRALQRYYRDVISPALANSWTDEDFNRSSTMLLAGGGSHYSDLVDAFKEEFDGVLEVKQVDEPSTLASRGYCLRSMHLLGSNNGIAVGLDIGNAQTALTLDKDANVGSWQ